MRRSKLEMYIDLLKTLAHRGPLMLNEIMFGANVNYRVLREYLDYMIKQDLVEEVKVGKKRVKYAITNEGVTVLGHFREIKQVIPPAIIRNIPDTKKGANKNGS